MALEKFYNLKVNPGAKSSRFVVDLKRGLPEEKPALLPGSRLEKLAEVDYGKAFKKGKAKSGIYLANIFETLKPEIALLSKAARKAKKQPVRRPTLFDQLAFIGLARLIFFILKNVFILLYRICYAAGWAIMFVFRLVYFIFAAIAKPFGKIFYSSFAKSHTVVHKISKNIPVGSQPAQSVVLAVSRKLPAYLASRREKNESRAAERGYSGTIGWGLKPVLVFAGVLLIIILPVKAFTYYKSLDSIKGRVLGASENALASLLSGGKAAADLDFGRADKSFAQAGDNFLNAQKQLEEINGLIFALASVAPDKNMQLAAAGKNILKAGELSARAGKNLSLAVESIFDYKGNGLNKALSDLSFRGHAAIADLTGLNEELNRINGGAIPEGYAEKFSLLKQKTEELNGGLKEFIGLADGLADFLGASVDKRYLLVFQNNSEARASGGFIGSYAIIDFSKGEIKNIEIPAGGSYDTDAGLLKKIKSPEPLRLIRPDWHFWDANWWPDWPTSARKLAWFYENSDGSTVDGVISFTPAVMEKILRIIGPIDLRDKYGLVINADNFWLETQKLAEQKPDVTKQPKKIIGDLMNKIIEELPKRLDKNNLVPMLKAAEESLTDKNILVYSTDSGLNNEIASFGWDGKIKDTAGDYLSVINTNIAGGKSDRKIKQQIIHQAQVRLDGSIIDNVTIRRTHEAIKREPFSGVRNVNWLRVYVPLGSKLIEANGFKPVDKIFFKEADPFWADDPDVARGEGAARTDEVSGTKIYDEFGKTVFANWSQLDPGETIEINIKYLLPFKLTDEKRTAVRPLVDNMIERAGEILDPGQKKLYSYSLLAQKQPGMNSSDITSELALPDNLKAVWQFNLGAEGRTDNLSLAENFNQDKLTAAVMEEKY